MPRGAWPSLAKRPVEAAVPGKAPTALSGTGTVLHGNTASGTDVDVGRSIAPGDTAAARLAVAARDVEQLEQRWRTQLTATQRTSAAIRARPGAGADADTAAQLEAGRLDKLAGQAADERAQLEAIAGDLAVAATTGVDVSEPLRAAGRLIVRCAKLTVNASSGGQPGFDAGAAKPH